MGFRFTDRDRAALDILDLCGQLDTKAIHRRVGGNFNNLQRRLGEFYNGFCAHPEHRCAAEPGRARLGFPLDDCGEPLWRHRCDARSLVARDPGQQLNFNARYQSAIYRLTELGRSLIEERQPFIARSGAFVHDFFVGSLMSAFKELAPPQTFMSRRDLLARPSCPREMKILASPFALPLQSGETVEPDDLFGLAYEAGGYRYFALEADRGSERVAGSAMASASIAKKVRLYQSLLNDDIPFRRFGFRNLTILFATTSERRVQTMVEHFKSNVSDRWRSRFLVQAFSGFGQLWTVPNQAVPVFDAWSGADGAVDISRARKQHPDET